MTTQQTSAYQLFFIEIRAIKGTITKRDEKVLDKCIKTKRGTCAGDKATCIYCGDTTKVDEYINFLASRANALKKNYEVRIFTDKQMEMATTDFSYKSSDIRRHKIAFTAKQEENKYIFGPKYAGLAKDMK